MYWKETGGVEKLFSLPSRTIPARGLFTNYNRRLISHFSQLEDFSSLGPSDVLALENCQNEFESASNNLINQNKRGRKRKQDLLAFSNTVTENVADASSLALPEAVREEEASAISRISLNITSNHQESLVNCNEQHPIGESSRLDVSDGSIPPFHPTEMNSLVNDTPQDFNQNVEIPTGFQNDSMEMMLDADKTLVNTSDKEHDTSDEIRNTDHLVSDWCDYECPPSVEPQVNYK